jgi:three-Cys-motif partner protein
MSRKKRHDPAEAELPFDTIQPLRRPSRTKLPPEPIWTQNKAKLIERYLYYFAIIAKHGTYIDGFAGPQQPDKHEMWAAKLVLESQPRWFRNFYLFDDNKNQVARLQELKDSQPPQDPAKKEPKREIVVEHGNCNSLIINLLKSGKIKEKEATFCLLDQRTFECEWRTLVALSKYKSTNKIELFYFLPHSWLDRAIAAQRDKTTIQKWWGRADWAVVADTPPGNRVLLFIDRFKTELGYWSVEPWPIFKSRDANQVMYYMIHATDHSAAPAAMQRAYAKAVGPKEAPTEVQMDLEKYIKSLV